MNYILFTVISIIIFGCWRSWKNKPRNRAEEFSNMLKEQKAMNEKGNGKEEEDNE